ncbi:hypothetical protein FM112_14315 [Gulosibacter sp. 10]|nr:hypothetical protein FM112_14315 [Gulosibacter sp. 10]
MRASVWLYAFCMSVPAVTSIWMALGSARTDVLLGEPEPSPDWLFFGLGLFVLLAGQAGTFGLYSGYRPWQRRRKGAFVLIGWAAIAMSVMTVLLSLLGQLGVERGVYRGTDERWDGATWTIFWLPHAIAAVLLVAGLAMIAIGRRQYREDAAFVKSSGVFTSGSPNQEGRILSIEGAGELDRVLIETAAPWGVARILCVTDNAGRNGWMTAPGTSLRVLHDPMLGSAPEAWGVWVNSWRRMRGARLQPREVLVPMPQERPRP